MLLNDVIQRKEMIQAIKTPDEEGQKISREEIRERKAAKAEVVDGFLFFFIFDFASIRRVPGH